MSSDELRRAERALAEVTRQLEGERLRARNLEVELERIRSSRTIRWSAALRRAYARLRVAALSRRAGGEAAATLPRDEHYAHWLARETGDPASLRREAETLSYRPLVSIVLPTYNSDPRWLGRAVESVRQQAYDRWELCVADDSSTRPETRELLGRLQQDERIHVRYRERNGGISAASNDALDAAAGEFVAFLDHDDELHPAALLEVVRRLNEDPALDVVYTDEDKRRDDGPPERAFFKPDWSPDLLLTGNYVNHLCVYRRALVEQVGRLRSELDGSQDFDLLLRVTELTGRVAHVPSPLYTWRAVEGSAAGSTDAKPWAYEAGRGALAAALERRGLDAEPEVLFPGRFRVRHALDRSVRVSVVVASSSAEADSRTRASIEAISTYPVHELVASPAEASGDVLVLCGGVEVRSPQWLEALLEHVQRPEVGAAGPTLVSPEGRLVHAGVVLLPGGVAAEVDERGSFFQLQRVVRNVSAVSGACLAIRTGVFRELGGLAPEFGPLGGVDLCLRAGEHGLRVLYTPHATVVRHANPVPRDAERAAFEARWRGRVDPFYNPNLSDTVPYALGTARWSAQNSRS